MRMSHSSLLWQINSSPKEQSRTPACSFSTTIGPPPCLPSSRCYTKDPPASVWRGDYFPSCLEHVCYSLATPGVADRGNSQNNFQEGPAAQPQGLRLRVGSPPSQGVSARGVLATAPGRGADGTHAPPSCVQLCHVGTASIYAQKLANYKPGLPHQTCARTP